MQKHLHDPKSKKKVKAKPRSKDRGETKAESPAAKRDEERQHATPPAAEQAAKHEGTASSETELEGEGSYTAGRRYDDSVRDFVDSGAVEGSAREAQRAVDSPEGDDLRDAERIGKGGARSNEGTER